MGEKNRIAENWLEALNKQNQLGQIEKANQYSEKYGLTLNEEDTKLLMQQQRQTLKAERRVEFGESVLPKIIYAFCDSDYISQSTYTEDLIRLQEIFYAYKNEMLDEITDDELLEFMKEQFETVCFGDFDYLEGTCLDVFAQAIRAGYREHQVTGGHGNFQDVDIVTRWNRNLFLQALEQLW